MQIIDSWIGQRVSELSNELVASQHAGSIGYFDAFERSQEIEAELSWLRSLAGWYRTQVESILAMAGGEASLEKIAFKRGGQPDIDNSEYRESPQEALARLAKSHGDLSHRLKKWCDLLVARGQLTSSQAAQVDFHEPVNKLLQSRQQQKNSEREDFHTGFERLRQAVKDYAIKSGGVWQQSERDFLNCWNRNKFEKTEAGLLQFARRLGESDKKLLPLSDRFANSVSELLNRVKAAVS